MNSINICLSFDLRKCFSVISLSIFNKLERLETYEEERYFLPLIVPNCPRKRWTFAAMWVLRWEHVIPKALFARALFARTLFARAMLFLRLFVWLLFPWALLASALLARAYSHGCYSYDRLQHARYSYERYYFHVNGSIGIVFFL